MLAVALAGLALVERLGPTALAAPGTHGFRIVLAITTDLALLAAFASLLRGSHHAVSFQAGAVAATLALEGTDALPLLLSLGVSTCTAIRGRTIILGCALALGCHFIAHEAVLLRHHLQHYVDAVTEPPMVIATRLVLVLFLARQAERALGARWLAAGTPARSSS